MVTMRAVRTGPRTLDLSVSLLAGLLTGIGSKQTVATWLPHDAIILLAAAQAVMLLARRRAPTAVLAGTAAVGVFMIVAGFPTGSSSFGAWGAAYAVAVYGRGDEGAELVVTLRHAAVVAVAAIAFGVATLAPGARGQSGIWGVLARTGARGGVLGAGVRDPHAARLYRGTQGPGSAARGRGRRARRPGGRRRAAADRPRAARRHRPFDQLDHDPGGGGDPFRAHEPGRGARIPDQDLGCEPAGTHGDAARPGRPATGRRGRAQPAALAGGPRRARRAAERAGDCRRGSTWSRRTCRRGWRSRCTGSCRSR